MDSSIAPDEPIEGPGSADPVAQSVIDLADRLALLQQETGARFDAMRDAFAHLRSRLDSEEQACIDDTRRRLKEFLGYEPSMQQQIDLITVYAAWHATSPKLQENQTAEFTTKKGQLVKYGYADLAAVIEAAQSAAKFGLIAFTRQEFDDNGHAIVTGYLVHSGGGALSCGPVPLFTGDSDRRGQAHAAGLTTCRRLALQMVLGLAAERDDNFNNTTETLTGGDVEARSNQTSQPRTAQPSAVPPRRIRDGAAPPAATVRRGPPPGWLSRDERAALERELSDPTITPDRFQQIEAKLLAAQQIGSGNAPLPGGQGQ
jgi:hypothetical protein